MISVLIANYNNQEFILDCIESIYNQSLDKGKFEVIICDDCSLDESFNILTELNKKFEFKLLKNSINLGVGATKKRLVEESSGEWFIFVDSDDIITFDCLDVLFDYICKIDNSIFSVLYANSMQLIGNGDLIDWNRSKIIHGTLLEDKFNYPIFHPVIYNRKLYNLTIGIDINLKSADDFDLWYKMEEVGKILFINKNLYYYRLNFNGVSQTGNDRLKWLKIMLELSYCSANAAKRRGLDVRGELDMFSELIFLKLNKQKYRRTKSFFKSIVIQLKFNVKKFVFSNSQ